MHRSDFEYELPERFIAQYPLADRAASKLLLLARQTGTIEHATFSAIGAYFKPGDVLVVNDTKVIPARIMGRKVTGGVVELLLLEQKNGLEWDVLLRPSSRVKPGAMITVGNGSARAEVLTGTDAFGIRRVRFHVPAGEEFWQWLAHTGAMPLPPYLKREVTSDDTERYQTVFARERGAVAAPTAGLHFTPALLDDLRTTGVEIVAVTLHVGYGTFRPVSAERLEDHVMHHEWFSINDAVAQTINAARREGRRIVACGTTTVRALESAACAEGTVQAGERYTNIFIYPPYQFKTIDALITNFHLPSSTLLMLVSAFAGRERILAAYEVAKQNNYRFYSYGDAMMIC